MKNIAIIGAGGLSKEVAMLIEDINKINKTWNIIGHVDKEIGKSIGRYKVVFNDETLLEYEDNIHLVFGIGDPKLIRSIYEKINCKKNHVYPNLVHPQVVADWSNIIIGNGNIITAGCILTTDISIGSFNYFNLGCTVGHDSIIEEMNIINPSVNISGGVKIGKCNLLGTGSQLLQYIEIGNNNIVGAGSVVTKNIIEQGTYVGIPARKIK